MTGKSSAILKVLISGNTPAQVAGTLSDLQQLIEEYGDETGCEPGELKVIMENEEL